MSWRFLSLALLATPLALAASAPAAHADGPWRAQVVDPDTRQPLPDVVVLAIWSTRSAGLFSRESGVHDVFETVTDTEGRFVMPARSTVTVNPFVSIEGPRVLMFKSGYGNWYHEGLGDQWSLSIGERARRAEAAKQRFEGEGAVIELRKLKTREERRQFLPGIPMWVEKSRVPRYLEALDREAEALGLQPLGK